MNQKMESGSEKLESDLQRDSFQMDSNTAAVIEEKSPIQEILSMAGLECDKSCVIVAIIAPMVFIFLLATVLLTKHKHAKRSLHKQSPANSKKGGKRSSNGDDCDMRNGDLPLMQLDNDFKFEATTIDAKWEYPRDSLILDTVLDEGEFGKVMKGYATDIDGKLGVTTVVITIRFLHFVAMKMLKQGANSVEYMALMSEFQLLQEVSHPNVIKLLGACTKDDSPMIIIEYARYGSLRSYLRLSRKIEQCGVDFTDGIEPITECDILSFAFQICKGMTYLTEIKLVHRDLAARNVLLAENKICKISDFGLTRDVYEDDAYLKRSRDRVPVKVSQITELDNDEI
ncbi:hypothetical protein GQX74_001702 [Glossina fuscipes]|nr:hypothetical protein GQX74_001702 [Glossina fuscipes]